MHSKSDDESQPVVSIKFMIIFSNSKYRLDLNFYLLHIFPMLIHEIDYVVSVNITFFYKMFSEYTNSPFKGMTNLTLWRTTLILTTNEPKMTYVLILHDNWTIWFCIYMKQNLYISKTKKYISKDH